MPLAGIPFTLKGLLAVYQNQIDKSLPKQFAALLKDYTTILWEKTKKQDGWIPYDEMAEKLSRFATALIDEGEIGFVEIAWASNQLNEKRRFGRSEDNEDANALFVVAERAGFINMSEADVKFSHSIFQGYFAGVALVRDGVDGIIQSPTFDPQDFRRLPQKWDNAVRIACQLVDNADEILLTIGKKTLI